MITKIFAKKIDNISNSHIFNTNWIRKHVDQSFCIQSKNLDIISTLKPADWLLLSVGMKSLWEWRRLSLLLFMTGSWLLCDKSPHCVLFSVRCPCPLYPKCSVTSLHNGSSPHHVTASRRVTHLIHVSSPTTVLFGVQKFTNETMDICIFRL